MKEGKQPSDITGITETEEIGRKDGLVYLFTKPENDVSALTKEQQDLYQTLRDLLPTIRSSIAFTTSGETNLPAFPEFSVVDLNGNTVDNSVFSGYQLPMVNMWGTFCVPCIEEMPMLEEISQSFPKDVQLIGILVDVYDNDTTYADQIIADTGVSYPNLIADGALRTYMEENIIAYPTTLFVDSNGNIVGDAVVGEREADVYLTVLQDRLDLLNG